MPRVVRNVLLISLATSVAMLGLVGLIHVLQNASQPPHPAETDREPTALPVSPKSAAG